MGEYNILIYIFFGIMPSLIWLFYYLAKDLHPEPKRMIIKIFLWGSLITIPVFFVQVGLTNLLNSAGLDPKLSNIIYWFLVIALSEEIFKYLVVRLKVVGNHHLDEPLDVMLYMVVAALGFAALENIFYLFAPATQLNLEQLLDRVMMISFVRFIGATLLHALCSAIIGYSMAMSFCHEKRRWFYVNIGMIVAVFLHGLYNFSIMTLESNQAKVTIAASVIVVMTIIVFIGFEQLKKKKGICQIDKNLIKK